MTKTGPAKPSQKSEKGGEPKPEGKSLVASDAAHRTIEKLLGEGSSSLPDGVYFGLDEEIYHKQTRLGSTSLKYLLTSGPDFWWNSWMNTLIEQDPDASSAKLSGSALHKIVLEGEDAFYRAYAPQPDREKIEGLLETMVHLQTWLTDNGGSYKSSNKKGELIALVRAHAAKIGVPTPPIWDLIIDELKASGKTVITATLYHRCRIASRMITANPHLSQSFVGGYPEVSVLWTEDMDVTMTDGTVKKVAIPCKARIDYLKLRACVDLKTIANQGALPFDVAIQRAIGTYRYDTQFAHYMAGRAAMRGLIERGVVFDLTKGATVLRKTIKDGAWVETNEALMPPSWWLEDLAKRPHVSETEDQSKGYSWIWLFIQKTSAPMAKGYEFRPEGQLTSSVAFASRRQALTIFAENMVKFGDGIWIADGAIQRLDDSHLPSWIMDAAA